MGHGDLDDLAELTRWAGDLGAGFVLVNPLHAPAPAPPVASPYLPVTRRFVSPLYVRVELVPEFAYLTGAVRAEIERTRCCSARSPTCCSTATRCGRPSGRR